MVYEALKVAEMLSNPTAQSATPLVRGAITVDFLNIHTIKPLDVNAIIASAQKTGKVVVIEEHNIHGGLGDAVASVLCENHPTRLLKIGINDSFGESGTHRELWKKYGLDRTVIFDKINTWIHKITR